MTLSRKPTLSLTSMALLLILTAVLATAGYIRLHLRFPTILLPPHSSPRSLFILFHGFLSSTIITAPYYPHC
jgi:hypothetical protein